MGMGFGTGEGYMNADGAWMLRIGVIPKGIVLVGVRLYDAMARGSSINANRTRALV